METNRIQSLVYWCLSAYVFRERTPKVGSSKHDYCSLYLLITYSSWSRLSCERPLRNIFNFYVFLTIRPQFAIHIVSVVYITNLPKANNECVPFIVICQITNRMSVSRRGPIDLEANLLNTTIYLIGLSQQVSTFAVNFQVCYSTQERLCPAKYAVTGSSIPRVYKREPDALLRPRWC